MGFNWDSYYEPPDVDDQPCEICGEDIDHCICPECTECGSYGDPRCYINHGMKRTEEQKFSLECANRWWERQACSERECWKSMIDEGIF